MTELTFRAKRDIAQRWVERLTREKARAEQCRALFSAVDVLRARYPQGPMRIAIGDQYAVVDSFEHETREQAADVFAAAAEKMLPRCRECSAVLVTYEDTCQPCIRENRRRRVQEETRQQEGANAAPTEKPRDTSETEALRIESWRP